MLCVGEASLGQEQKEINAIFACECQQRTFKPVQYMFQDLTNLNKIIPTNNSYNPPDSYGTSSQMSSNETPRKPLEYPQKISRKP